MSAVVSSVTTGVLLPESVLWHPWAQVLATFVAINTVMYVAIAVAKMLPKVHPTDWVSSSYARSQSRSIHDGEPEIGAPPISSPLDGDPRNWARASSPSQPPPAWLSER